MEEVSREEKKSRPKNYEPNKFLGIRSFRLASDGNLKWHAPWGANHIYFFYPGWLGLAVVLVASLNEGELLKAIFVYAR